MLAYRIVNLRKRMGITQSELAQKLNISASTEGMYEQGRRTPNLDMLISMSRIFEVSLDYLVTGKEYQNSSTTKNRIPNNCPCATCFWKDGRQ